jgi:threonine/homoserine/homoserine lactone efflux protein
MELYLTILLFAISSSVTPGPNNIMIMTSGLNFGIKKSLPHLFGICLGFPVMVIIVGLGFSVVFDALPFLHQVIKVVGVVYLLYLSWQIGNSATTSLDGTAAKPFGFWQAFLFQWVNAKAWVMATGAISAYTSLSSSIYSQVLIIALAFFIVAFPCVGIWLVGGNGLKRYLQHEKHQKVFNVTMALLLVASILPVVWSMIF